MIISQNLDLGGLRDLCEKHYNGCSSFPAFEGWQVE